jgi:hypothetical protein
VKLLHVVGWFIWIVWWCTDLLTSNTEFKFLSSIRRQRITTELSVSGSNNFTRVCSLSSAHCYKDHCDSNISNFIGRYKIWHPDDMCLHSQIIPSFCLVKNHACSSRYYFTFLFWCASYIIIIIIIIIIITTNFRSSFCSSSWCQLTIPKLYWHCQWSNCLNFILCT